MSTLAFNEDTLKVLLIVGGAMGIVLVWILASTVGSMQKTAQRERTRREIAAYLAEGSIRPEDAAILLGDVDDDVRKQIASAVAWGTIKPKDAERLLQRARGSDSSPATPPA